MRHDSMPLVANNHTNPNSPKFSAKQVSPVPTTGEPTTHQRRYDTSLPTGARLTSSHCVILSRRVECQFHPYLVVIGSFVWHLYEPYLTVEGYCPRQFEAVSPQDRFGVAHSLGAPD